MKGKNINKLPSFFKPILWSYIFNSIDLEKDKKTIIINTINYGDLNHWQWIVKYYGKKEVKKILMNIPFTEIRSRVVPLVSLLFSINKYNHAPRSKKNIEEIAASKAYTIGRRGSFKDYIDLYYIISGKYSDLNKVIGLTEKKYRNEFNSRLFLEQLIYLEDITDEQIIFLKERIDKKTLKGFFEKKIRDYSHIAL